MALSQLDLRRSKRAALLFALLVFSVPEGLCSINLPESASDPAIPALSWRKTNAEPTLSLSLAAQGANNLSSLWDVADYGQPPTVFRGNSGYAAMGVSRKVRMRLGNWWLEAGSGWLDEYDGNPDAAQLWLDLHSGVAAKDSYTPYAYMRQISAQWQGIGYSFPARWKRWRGSIGALVRHISAGDYTEGVVTGQVAGDQFSGTARIASADYQGGRSIGRGQCLDTFGHFAAGRWTVRFQAEGLAGQIRWKGLAIEDGYISSPAVFTDSEGFLRDIGGDFSGLSWRTDRKLRISPALRLAAVRHSQPAPLLSLSLRSGDEAALGVGLAWKSGSSGTVYVRRFLSDGVWEAGAVGGCWSARIAADAWPAGSPTNALVEVSVSTPVR